MDPRLLLLFLLFSWPPELSTQAWPLRHHYPLELPGQVKYAQFPDSLLRFFKADEGESLEQVRNKPEAFQPVPETIQLEEGDVYWLKGAFSKSDTTGRPFLVEADGFRKMQHYWEFLERLWSAVDVYLFAGDSLVQRISTGDDIPPADRLIRDARQLFWITSDYSDHITFFIRLVSKVKLRRPGFGVRVYDQNSMYDLAGYTFRSFGDESDNHRYAWPIKQVLSALYSLEYVIDTQQVYTFSELDTSWDRHARYFQPEYLNLAAAYPFWCRLRVTNLRDSSQLYWFVPASSAPKIEAFIPVGKQKYKKVITGKKVPMEDKQIPHVLNLISFELPPHDTSFVYLKYYPVPNIKKHQNSGYDLPLFFVDRTEVLTRSRTLGLWKGFILGVFIFQIIYFALRAGLERDRLGAYYLLVIIGFLLFFIGVENKRNTFFAWQIFFEFNHLIIVLCSLVPIGFYLFSNRYLQLKQHFPKLLKVQQVDLFLIIGITLLLFIQRSTGDHFDTAFFYQLPIIVMLFLFVGMLLLLYVVIAIAGVINGHPHALSYLVAFSPFCLVGLIICFQMLYFKEDIPIWQMNLLYLSFIATTILFAVVVAKRNNAASRKEIQADNLIELNRAKSRFYDNVTHEFRTPLTVIRGLANMIHGHEEEKALIQKNSQEVLNLVDQLIGFSKAQSGVKPPKFVEDNIIIYLEYLLEGLQPLAREKRISIRFLHQPEEIILEFDREKFRLIFNNLLTNAIKYTPAGGAIQVTAGLSGHQFVLVVRDNGIGMSPEELANIFDRYYQVRDSLKLSSQIGGIGLALIKEELDCLAGSISVDSKKGLGTTFTVRLPLHPAPDEREKIARESADLPLSYPVGNEHVVLLVEDHPDVRFYLNRLLSPDYKIVTASDGAEGWEKAAELIPDIIISDVMMPKMDGYRLTSKLKEDLRTSHIPVILLTAKSRHQDRLQGLSGGADAYLIKPFEEEELKIRIRKLIENREQLRKIFAGDGIRSGKEKAMDPFLSKALVILEEHFADEDFGVGELVQGLHLSRMQVHRKLKALTGLSTCQFINHFRLEKAKQLMLQSELNVSEAAYSCGFGDPAYFSKLFSKAYGQSPLQFKQASGA